MLRRKRYKRSNPLSSKTFPHFLQPYTRLAIQK
jgi:hypothetical protein